jgi:metal-sulfur cluster biosynthetic enzyme/rhodanese-related sulfurtransferase
LVLGLLVAALGVGLWRLVRRVRDLEARLADVRALRRETEAARDDLVRGLGLTRAHLAAVAAGDPPPDEAIRRGIAWREVSAAEAQALWERDPSVVVLDVRTPAEFASGHVPRAVLVPLDEIEDRLDELPERDAPLLVVCAAGGRSLAACRTLAEHGWTRLLNLAGGMHAWNGPRDGDASGPAARPLPEVTAPAVTVRGGAIAPEQVIAAIRECCDPEIPLNVYDLGLIYGIDIDAAEITVRMTLTSESCPSARAIPEDVRQRVAALGQPNVRVELVWDPPWHPARISADGKQRLGLA